MGNIFSRLRRDKYTHEVSLNNLHREYDMQDSASNQVDDDDEMDFTKICGFDLLGSRYSYYADPNAFLPPEVNYGYVPAGWQIFVDLKSYFSYITPQDELDIKTYIYKLFQGKFSGELSSLINSLKSMFSLYDCDYEPLTFLALLSFYVEKKEGTYLDVLKILNKGKDIEHVSELYNRGPDKKLSIGMVCKLFGLKKNGDMKKMDCPRVWDLETDEIVDNPNFGNESKCQIAAITHRWGSDEILYKHLVDIERTNVILKKLGQELESTEISTMSPKLAKIREELKDQIRYVWMDTLCIDKTNSTELDMSIRSMFKWYSSAVFVYLEAFTNFDEWCTRGWTLQEGAAAESLRISPVHGNSFMELISKLDDEKIYSLGLAKPYGYCSSIYWFGLMGSRETTMTEDKVYALIGLLDIDFQIAYGEGNKAISRVGDELAKQKGDVSWLANKRMSQGMSIKELSKRCLSPPHDIIQVNNEGINLDAFIVKCPSIEHNEVYSRVDIKMSDDDIHCWIPSNNLYIILRSHSGYTVDAFAALSDINTGPFVYKECEYDPKEIYRNATKTSVTIYHRSQHSFKFGGTINYSLVVSGEDAVCSLHCSCLQVG